MGRPRKLRTEHRELILFELHALTPLFCIARMLQVHRHTLERFIHSDCDLEQALYDALSTRFIQRSLEFKGDPRKHALRTLYAWERLNPERRRPGGKTRSSWRNYVNDHPSSLFPQRPDPFLNRSSKRPGSRYRCIKAA